jgi:hypothetical protein
MMIGLMFQAVAFITEGNEVKQFIVEQFQSGPTRASDCRCLPGYIPSKQIAFYEFVVVPELGGMGYVFQGNTKKQFYWGMHSTSFGPQNTKYRVTNAAESGKYKGDGYISREKLQEALQYQKQGTLPNTPTYFCQSLSNPSDTKQCY